MKIHHNETRMLRRVESYARFLILALRNTICARNGSYRAASTNRHRIEWVYLIGRRLDFVTIIIMGWHLR